MADRTYTPYVQSKPYKRRIWAVYAGGAVRIPATANTVHKRHIYDTAYIHGRPKPMYGHTDTNTVRNLHIQMQLYGVSGYAVFAYVRFWPTLHYSPPTTA